MKNKTECTILPYTPRRIAFCICYFNATAQVLEEIMVQNHRQSPEQLTVYRRPTEYIVDIPSATMQLPGKPYHRTTAGLLVEYLLYSITDM